MNRQYKMYKIKNRLITRLGAGIVALSLAGISNNALENRVIAAEQAADSKSIKNSKEKNDEYIEFGDVRVYKRDIEEDSKRMQKEKEEKKRLNIKDEYTFEEVAKVLGERYFKLDEKQKRIVEDNYRKGEEHIRYSYNSNIGILYNKKLLEDLDKVDVDEELRDFKISELKKEVLDEYLEAFPWIKRENIKAIDQDPKNPDKALIFYAEYYKNIKKNIPEFSITPKDLVRSSWEIFRERVRSYFQEENKDRDKNKK